MKLSVRFSILVALMIVVAIVMYQTAMNVIIPWILGTNDDIILSGGLILSVAASIFIWVAIGEFLMKTLKCEDVVDKFTEDI